MSDEKLTPLMQQFRRIKSEHPDSIVFFRMGDFYEMFGDDAIEGARILGITCTSRAHGGKERIPLAGVPVHAADRYLAKLAASGRRIVVCEQTEDPKKAKGLVKREVVEILTPGTIMLSGALDDAESPFCMAVAGPDREGNLGVALVEVSTGLFRTDERPREHLDALIGQWRPREILWPETDSDTVPTFDGALITPWPDWRFNADEAARAIRSHYDIADPSGFPGTDTPLRLSAAGALLSYLRETKKAALAHLGTPIRLSRGTRMELDPATVRNLELVANRETGELRTSLFGVLDRCHIAMGRRLLKNRLLWPLNDRAEIDARLDEVAFFVRHNAALDRTREQLKGIFDLERFCGRLGVSRITPVELAALRETLLRLPLVVEAVGDKTPTNIRDRIAVVPDMTPLRETLERAIVDDPPRTTTDGNIFRAGHSQELDNLRDGSKDARQWIATLQDRLRGETEIPSLKVGYNKVFGYYIEVSHPHKDKVPREWIRKQTLVSAERYITPEMKDKEEQILGATERINALEQELFETLRDTVAEQISGLKQAAELLATLDVACSIATVALTNRYTRPQLSDDVMLDITDGRHPVLEVLGATGTFVPNDTKLKTPDSSLHILTGPNMAGKSTILRQIGLIVLMAQIGSFVPARRATIGIVDRIFTRVGAGDDLTKNRSTFMMEMTETAQILAQATSRSLILLDEIGRGTSTYDGLAIAWSVGEHIATQDHLRCRTVFATHYHELTALADRFYGVANFQMAVAESGDKVAFLHRVVPGGCDDSYGIYVARLAGLPSRVVERARTILAELENGDFAPLARQLGPAPRYRSAPKDQISLFGGRTSALADRVAKLDPDNMTPLEALGELARLKRDLNGDKADNKS